MNCACAILAGGPSARMRQDKATIRIGERALIQLVYDKVKEVFDDVMIITKFHDGIEGVDAPVLKDAVSFRGPMAGIVSALLYSEKPYTFVVACDMPFLAREALEYMISQIAGQDIVIPKTRQGYEPLHAIYNRTCIAHFFRLMEKGKLAITEVLPFVSVKELKENPCFFVNNRSVFANMNTIKDLETLQRK